MLSAATSCSSRLHHCPRLARFVLASKSSLLYSSKPFMNIPSVPGGNGPIFDTRYCRRKILQNLRRGVGGVASAEFAPRPRPTSPFAWGLAPAALVLDRKKLAAFSAAAGRFLQFPIGDRRCKRRRASVSNAGGNARPSLTNARQL